MNILKKSFIQYGLGKINSNNTKRLILFQYHTFNVIQNTIQPKNIVVRRLCTRETPPSKPKDPNPMKHTNNSDTYNVSTTTTQYLEFEKKLMDTFELRDKKKARQLIYGGILIFITIFIFYESLKSYFSKQTAEAVSVTLQQDELQKETDKLAKQITKSVLEDESTYEYIGKITNDTIRDKSTQQALQQMLYEIYLDPEFQTRTKEFVQTILKDPVVQEQVTKVLQTSVQDITNDPNTHKHVKEALVEIMDNEEFLQETYVSVWSIWKRFCTFGVWK